MSSTNDQYKAIRDPLYDAKRRKWVVSALRAGLPRSQVQRIYRIGDDAIKLIMVEEGFTQKPFVRRKRSGRK